MFHRMMKTGFWTTSLLVGVMITATAVVSAEEKGKTKAKREAGKEKPAPAEKEVKPTKFPPGEQAYASKKGGKVDKWVTYDDSGKPVKVETDTNGDGKKDVVMEYEGDRPARAGNLDADGKVAIWTYFKDGKFAAAPAGSPPPAAKQYVTLDEAKKSKTRGLGDFCNEHPIACLLGGIALSKALEGASEPVPSNIGRCVRLGSETIGEVVGHDGAAWLVEITSATNWSRYHEGTIVSVLPLHTQSCR